MERLKHLRILMVLAPGMFLALAGCARAPVNKTLQAEEALIGGKGRTHQPHPSEKGCKGDDQGSGGLPLGGCGGLPMLL